MASDEICDKLASMTLNPSIHDALKPFVSKNDPTDKFMIRQEIGFGKSGTVYLARDVTTMKMIAIKKINLKIDDPVKIAREIEALKMCEDERIVKYLESYVVGDRFWLVMEYVDGCDLTEIVSNAACTEGEIATISKRILEALKVVHAQEIVHRDIKSDNVLIGKTGAVKLADFGMCARVTKTDLKDYVGTAYWVAPEVAQRKRHSYPADVWSFGITVIEMVDQEPPNYSIEPEFVVAVIAGATKSPKPKSKVSPDLASFIARCVELDPADRATIDELIEHPFLDRSVSLDRLMECNSHLLGHQ